LDYLNKRDLGYSKDQIITIPYFGDELGNRYEAFHIELVRGGAVKNASRSSIIPTGRLLDSQGSSVQRGDSMAATDIVIKDVRIDPDFFDTYQIPLASGRNFSKEIKSDDSLSFVINEAAVRMIGWNNDEAMGKVFLNGGTKGQVIGVVKDFHFESLHEEIIPIVFHMQPNYRRVSVRVDGKDFQGGIRQLEKVWNEFLPERPFEYRFLSDRYKELYESEQKQSQLFVIFSGLAIFIASLGLFGLATFNALQRTKEIGIRKVMGASLVSILQLLSKEIVLMIIIANLIAWPVAWYLTSQWLDGFAYRIDINFGVYLLAAIIALLIGVVTVSSQTIKAALTNPAITLRNE
jgi:putative ABC transport system permease protein